MRYMLLGTVWFGCVLAPAALGWDEVSAGLASITDEDVTSDLEYLTGDECAGRETGQRGMTKACEFVARRFADAGLEPFGTDQSFLQPYTLTLDDATSECVFAISTGQEGEVLATMREDFIPVRNSLEGSIGGPIVFVGYGIHESKYRWDDYRGIDVRGKVVLVLAEEPGRDGKGKFFDGPERTEAASLREKAKLAKDRGAVGMLVVAPGEDASARWLGAQYPIYQAHRKKPDPLALPSAVISHAVASKILGDDVESVADGIERKKKPDSAPCEATCRLEVSLRPTPTEIPNVVAVYRGSDPERAEEYVVVGAHVDHEGMDDWGRIYRGADDNAGGASAVMEVAEAFGKHRPEVARSVVFVCFTGEEKGLLGAAAFVKSPPFPIESAYAMINMDIISRGRKRNIEATLPNEKTVFDALIGKAVRLSKCGLSVGDGGKQFFQRSDHYEFHKAKVPSVFFNEGETNEDYHKWTDTADKVLEDKIKRVARLSFALACLAADSDRKGWL